MTEPTKEQKDIWRNEFYEWYRDCFSLDGDMAEQVKMQMFADMKYAYLAAKKSTYSKMMELEELQRETDEINKESIQWRSEAIENLNQEIKTLKEQLAKAEKVIGADIGYNVFEFHRLREEYFKDKEKQDKENKDEK